MRDIEFGTIRLKLDEIMKSQSISVNKLAFRSEMQRTQLKAYRDNNTQRVDLSVLSRLCFALECDIVDLLEYIPPVPKSETHKEN